MTEQKLEFKVGGVYRTRNGAKAHILHEVTESPVTPHYFKGVTRSGASSIRTTWWSNGLQGVDSGSDLVAYWTDDSPYLEPMACTAQELADEPILDAASGQQKDEPAWKRDGGKPRMDLIAPELLTAAATILTFGADKYAARNWEKGMSWGRVFGAMMRHLWAWWGGQKADDETGYSHLWHAACCLMFLIAYEERNIGTDDRKNPVDNP